MTHLGGSHDQTTRGQILGISSRSRITQNCEDERDLRAEFKREDATEAAWRLAPSHCRGCRYCVPEWEDQRFEAEGPAGPRLYGNVVMYPVCVLSKSESCPAEIEDCPKYRRPDDGK